tara:strand:- start:50 stop:880 length:831 start_codon:yes stop_codon:yes gene_type:complete
MKVKLLLIFFIFNTINLHAQDKKTFFVGLNIGAKFANKHYATRYTGAYQNELPLVFDNPQIHQNIYELLGNKDFAFYEYNENYRYSPAINYGVLLGYSVSPNLQASIDANFSQLKVKTSYNLEVFDPVNQTTQEQYSTGYIIGEEGRFNGKFNLDYISDGDKAKFIIGAQGLFSAWRMEQLLVELNNEQWLYNLYSVHDPSNNFTKKTSGSGWGYGINLGFEYRLNDKFVGQFMYQPYFSRVEYFTTKSQIEAAGSAYIKPKRRLEHDLTLRILWK